MAILSLLKQVKQVSHSKNNSASFDRETILNEKNFKDVFDSHHNPVFTLDEEGRFQYSNKSLKRTLGYTNRDINRGCEESMNDASKLLLKRYFQFAKEGTVQIFQTIIHHKNGSPLNVEVTFVPILDNDLHVIAISGLIKVITPSDVQNILHNDNEGIWSFDIEEKAFVFIDANDEYIQR